MPDGAPLPFAICAAVLPLPYCFEASALVDVVDVHVAEVPCPPPVLHDVFLAVVLLGLMPAELSDDVCCWFWFACPGGVPWGLPARATLQASPLRSAATNRNTACRLLAFMSLRLPRNLRMQPRNGDGGRTVTAWKRDE